MVGLPKSILLVQDSQNAQVGDKGSILLGVGDPDYRFPTKDDLVQAALRDAGKTIAQQERRRAKRNSTGTNSKGGSRVKAGKNLIGGRVSVRSLIEQLSALPRTAGQADPEYTTLVKAAEGLQFIQTQRRFEYIFAALFNDMRSNIDWARDGMPAKFRKAVSSLSEQLKEAEALYRAALPKVVAELDARYPQVPMLTKLEKADYYIRRQLGPIIALLDIYADTFEQQRNGLYSQQRRAVEFLMEQCFNLFLTGDTEGKAGTQVHTRNLHVGDVIIVRIATEGPATIPGSEPFSALKGPIGCHAVQVSFDELDMIALALALYAHEERHNIAHDVPGFLMELASKIALAVHSALSEKLKDKSVRMGEYELPAADLLAKFYSDTSGEVDADLCGGVLLTGPAYVINMLLNFPAMLVRGKKVSETEKLLRTDAPFLLVDRGDGNVELAFEPHPPDFARVLICAEALELLGFSAEAEQARRLAVLAIGGDEPETLSFEQAGDVQKPLSFQIPLEWIKLTAPVVARTIMMERMQSLGGQSMVDIIKWTTLRQKKVDLLTDLIVGGNSVVPTDKGDIFATYVAAAATMAYWKLVAGGADPDVAARKVNSTALQMLQQLQAKPRT